MITVKFTIFSEFFVFFCLQGNELATRRLVEVFAPDSVTHIVKKNSDNLAGKFNYLLKDKEFPSAEEMKIALKNMQPISSWL